MLPKIWCTYGDYSTFDQPQTMDWQKIIDHFKRGGIFNGLYFFLFSMWRVDQDNPCKPLLYDKARKLYLPSLNPEFFQEFRRCVRTFLENNMILKFALFDQYLKPVPGWFDQHPLVHNTFGSLTDKGLYDSIDLSNPHHPTFAWNAWEDDPETGQPINFMPINKIGQVLYAFMNKTFRILAQELARCPDGGIGIKMYNETRAGITDGKPVPSANMGDRHENFKLMQKLFTQAGLAQTKRVRLYNDYGVASRASTETQALEDWKLGVLGFNRAKWPNGGAYSGTIHSPMYASAIEFHSVGEGLFTPEFILSCGLDPSRVHLSTDAVMSGDGNKANKLVFKATQFKDKDLKAEEKNFPAIKFNRNQIMRTTLEYSDALAAVLG